MYYTVCVKQQKLGVDLNDKSESIEVQKLTDQLL